MSNFIARLARSEKGATAVEYGLICALIVLAALAAITAMGGSTKDLWLDMKNEVVAAGA